jgi:ubiquitin-conjugating enzyme E2 M
MINCNAFTDRSSSFAEAAEDLRKDRDQFLNNVKSSLKGGYIKGVSYDRVSV